MKIDWSSSSSRAGSTEFPDSPTRRPSLSAIPSASCVRTELMLVNLCWSPNTGRKAKMNSSTFKSSPLLFQQCYTCHFHLTWIFCEIGGRWACSCCFVMGCLCYIARYTDVWNRHRESKNTKLTKLVQVRNFYSLSWV